MKKPGVQLLILGLVLVAIVTRFYKLGQIPVSLYWDEVAMLVDAKQIVLHGTDMHGLPWYQVIFPSYGDYKLPVYIWLASLAVRFLGVSELALRLPSAVAGILTILTAGLLSYKLFPSPKKLHPLHLAVALTVTLSPWAIMFSRTGFEGHLGQLFLGMSIWLALLAHQKKWLLFPATLLAVVATYSYFSVRFVWPPVFVASQLLFGQWSVRPSIKSVLTIGQRIILPLLGFGLFLWPMFHSPWYQPSNQYRLSTESVFTARDYPLEANVLRAQAGNQLIDRLIFHRHFLLIKELLKNYSDHLSLDFLFLSGDANLRHGTGQHGLFLLVFLPFFLSGLFHLAQKNFKVLSFLIIWWLAALLPATVPETTPHALRSLNALLPLTLIIGFGLGTFVTKYQANLKIMTVIVFLISLSFFEFWHHYLVHYPQDSAFDWQEGYKEIAQLVLSEKANHDVIKVAPLSRLYLWLFAYDDQNQIDISQLHSENFGFGQIENIRFDQYDWSALKQESRRFMLVYPPKYLQDEINDQDKKYLERRDIYSVRGNLLYTGLIY